MTKEQKQLVLIGVLSITLYAVWPSRRKDDGDSRNASVANSSQASNVVAKAVNRILAPGNIESLSSVKPVRKRWTIDEILAMGRKRPSEALATPSRQETGVEAIYFTSSPGRKKASAIVGGKLVKTGESLPGNRIVGEIHRDRITIESVE